MQTLFEVVVFGALMFGVFSVLFVLEKIGKRFGVFEDDEKDPLDEDIGNIIKGD